MNQFNTMIQCADIENDMVSEEKLMGHMYLKSMDKGSSIEAHKIKKN